MARKGAREATSFTRLQASKHLQRSASQLYSEDTEYAMKRRGFLHVGSPTRLLQTTRCVGCRAAFLRRWPYKIAPNYAMCRLPGCLPAKMYVHIGILSVGSRTQAKSEKPVAPTPLRKSLRIATIHVKVVRASFGSMTKQLGLCLRMWFVTGRLGCDGSNSHVVGALTHFDAPGFDVRLVACGILHGDAH